MNLLPAHELVKTSLIDKADWNYLPLVGMIERARFGLAKRLLAGQRYRRLIEIGYGSGIFLPELAEFCDELYGIDVHSHTLELSRVLHGHGIDAVLKTGRAEALPFEDGMFDAVVAVSTVEFFEDLEKGCREIARVLAPSGRFVVVTPGHSAVADFGLWALTGESAREGFGSGRQRVMPALEGSFETARKMVWPPLVGHAVCLYRALALRPRGNGRS